MNICYYAICKNSCKGKFCSSSCRSKHYMEIKYPVSERNKCHNCGKTIRKDRKYCGPGCRVKKSSIFKNFLSYSELKQFCLDYKGGKCCKCGYDKCHSALHFHHIDPATKQYTISSLCTRHSISTQLIEELDKCILVCANCHAELHCK